MKVAIAGAGTMGAGIAQVAASAGHEVLLFDINEKVLKSSGHGLKSTLEKLVSKGKFTQSFAENIIKRITFTSDFNLIAGSSLVIEAVIEDVAIKRDLFKGIEALVADDTIIATNTSSLSIAEITSVLKKPGRALGIHFFNPAPVLPLVEIIPSLLTENATTDKVAKLIKDWGKTPVIAQDLPGFIVNRIARPYYGEALRIYEEGIADFSEIDQIMKSHGFKMGPFELMDLIGNDVNYTVSETVYREYYHDSRYKPSLLQKRMKQAGLLGRKSGRGFYDYYRSNETTTNTVSNDNSDQIFLRIISMLINEAAEAVRLNIASIDDIETAMTKGVNYPKGLLKWADELGLDNVFYELTRLQNYYGEERYRPSPLIREYSLTNRKFLD